ncbi:hypothetical protein KPP03845_200166 (plasmid) [Streptomyces xanthophaeus]|nr:hypothetical protein KPP03845_200166 [Streptomyces xanthophaeus]
MRSRQNTAGARSSVWRARPGADRLRSAPSGPGRPAVAESGGQQAGPGRRCIALAEAGCHDLPGPFLLPYLWPGPERAPHDPWLRTRSKTGDSSSRPARHTAAPPITRWEPNRGALDKRQAEAKNGRARTRSALAATDRLRLLPQVHQGGAEHSPFRGSWSPVRPAGRTPPVVAGHDGRSREQFELVRIVDVVTSVPRTDPAGAVEPGDGPPDGPPTSPAMLRNELNKSAGQTNVTGRCRLPLPFGRVLAVLAVHLLGREPGRPYVGLVPVAAIAALAPPCDRGVFSPTRRGWMVRGSTASPGAPSW